MSGWDVTAVAFHPPMCIPLYVSYVYPPIPGTLHPPGLAPLDSPAPLAVSHPPARALSRSGAAQVQYAALDAHILIALYQALNTRGE